MKHGYLLGEHIRTGKFTRHRYDDIPVKVRLRGFLFPVILLLIAVTFFWKLFSLQILSGNQYRALSDSNRMRTQIIHAPRGIIFDRNGVPLVLNTPGFRKINCKKVHDTSVCTTTPLSQEEALPLIAKGDKHVEVASFRKYPFKDAMSHVLGYIGQISEREIKDPEFAGYMGTDWIGKNGIEREYEHVLRGKDGKQLIEVDAAGKPVRSLGREDPYYGQDMTLTIDSKLQQAAFEATKDVKRGAVIVSKPDGEILVMVSRPSFDPNLFTQDLTYSVSSTSSYTKLQDVLTDTKAFPLLNRVIGGVYPPGSTFKLVTAAAGLQKGIIDTNYKVEDTGILKVGDFSYANWFYTEYGKKEPGQLDVTRALARSNDIFFYKLAEKEHVSNLADMGRQFGLGSKLGIDLGGEVSGTLPTEQWKKDNLGESWYLGDTYHYGIGQGFLLTTPLQVNSWTGTIANGGTVYAPRLDLKQTFDKSSGPWESKVKKQGVVDAKTVDTIRKGMIGACSPGGVAYPLFNFTVKNKDLPIDGKDITQAASKSADFRQITVACKTGTAQQGGDDADPHGWITLFAPAYKPQIVVTVLVEEGGEGSVVAAPIAKKILESYFGK
jgi:penicillin-binding protein 2